MGPTVCELEGPMPILKSSKRLVFIYHPAELWPQDYCRVLMVLPDGPAARGAVTS